MKTITRDDGYKIIIAVLPKHKKPSFIIGYPDGSETKVATFNGAIEAELFVKQMVRMFEIKKE